LPSTLYRLVYSCIASIIFSAFLKELFPCHADTGGLAVSLLGEAGTSSNLLRLGHFLCFNALICQDLNWCWHLFAATYSVYIAQGVRDHVSIGFAFQDSEKSLN
jgi:hypothetical protein